MPLREVDRRWRRRAGLDQAMHVATLFLWRLVGGHADAISCAGRRAMNAHVIDTRYLKDLFGTEELRAGLQRHARSFSAGSTSRPRWRAPRRPRDSCPPEAAAEITRKARAELIDLDALHEGVNFTGHPLISLVRQLAGSVRGRGGPLRPLGRDHAGRHRHRADAPGQGRARIILRDLRALAAALADLARARARHAAGGPHARPARHADHLRVQGRGLAGRGAAAHRAAGAGRAARARGGVRRAHRPRSHPSARTRSGRWRCSAG